MNSALKTFFTIAGILLIAGVGIFLVLKYNTKANSPEDIITFSRGDLVMEVFYNRPYKKERELFGDLVPYNEVWRTGANEATTFETNKDILIDGSELKAGKYTLWTIPMEDSWKVIFNASMYPWGINLDEEAYRDPAHDALIIEVPVNKTEDSLEQFTISFEEENDLIFLKLAWDRTYVELLIKEKEPPPGDS